MKKIYFYLLGLITGFLNGLFGAGSGIVAVPLLKKLGIETRKAHATSIALIFPLSCISAYLYSRQNDFNYSWILILIPFGLLGAIIGSLFLKKISTFWLRKVFGIVLILSSLRMMIG